MAAQTMNGGDTGLRTSDEGDAGSPAENSSALADMIVRSATDFAIVTSDTDGLITSWSPGAEKTMGWSTGEAIGQRVDLFFTPEDVAARQPGAEMDEARRNGFARDERWHMKADGSRFWANGELQPMQEAGSIVSFVKILRDRTEHHEMEQRLRDARAEATASAERLAGQERRLRDMFASTPGFVAVLRGPTHIYEMANTAYYDVVGHRDIIGKAIRDALPEVEGQDYFERFDKVFATGTPIRGHLQPAMIQREAGAPPEQRYVDYVIAPIKDADGAVTGLFVEGFDTTEIALARAAAEKIAAEQAAILGQLGEGVIATNADGRITFVNAAAERLHGVARLDVEPRDYSESYQLLTEDGVPYPSGELPLARAVMRGETVTEARWRIRRPDGTQVLAIGNAQPVIADGRQVGAVLTLRDDTARREAESALDDSRAYLRLLLNSTQEAFYSVDTEGVTQVCNTAFVRMLGFEREEDAVGRTLHDLIHHHHADGAVYPVSDCPIYRCAKTGASAHVTDEVFFRLDGTPFPVDYRVAPIVSGGKLSGAICTFSDVSEQRQTERALRETEERYRYAVRATTDAVWDWDLVGDGILWNEALRTAYGHDLINTSGEWWIEHIHPDDRARVDAGIHAAIDGTGTHWTDEYRFLRADGGYADVLDRGAVVRDADGRATRMIGAMFDLTDRTAAQQALRASEERYRTLFEAIDAGFCVIEVLFDADGCPADYRFLEINSAFEKQTGLSHAIGKTIREFAPDMGNSWIGMYGRVVQTGEPERHEDFFPELDRWFDVHAYPVDAPELNRVAVLFNDISERKRAEVRLHELNRTLETRVAETVAERDMIWRSSQDLFVVGGLDGVYRSANPAWEDALGYSSSELVGLRFDALVHPDDAAETGEEFARLAEGEVVKGLDLRMRHKDGAYRWFSWTCVPRNDIFYASGRDVTARKELEEQLRQSQKMEAVGQLTGGIAHDFNNLLTIVSGNIDMARRSLGADGDARALRSLGNAAKGADRAAALTQRLLAFSRRQPLQPRATDVNKLITGMTELLDRALGETVDLQVVAGAGLWRVEVDPNQLENAVLNLAVNARDAMPGGGKLTVETTNAHIDEAYAAAQREVAPGQYVLISVTDTGEGMAPDVVAKAFDPFFSTKDVGRGTGLGLSQVYGYVKQSGGHVKIYSEPNEGTTIKLYLPRLIADMNPADEEEVVPEAPTQGKESILVVEDDDDVRIYTVDSLRELGYRVLEAHDGASALRLLERRDEPPQLLLTDVVMPGMSGRDLADQSRVLYPDMRILYTTGYARNAIVHGGRLDFGVELLPKPFTFEALAAKIRDVIEKSAVERALIVDPVARTSDATAAMLEELGFAAEYAGSLREALGKLRAAGGRFDVVILGSTLPTDNLEAVLTELHAVRNDLPVLVTARDADKAAQVDPCVGILSAALTSSNLRDALSKLRIRCADR